MPGHLVPNLVNSSVFNPPTVFTPSCETGLDFTTLRRKSRKNVSTLSLQTLPLIVQFEATSTNFELFLVSTSIYSAGGTIGNVNAT